MSLPSIERRRSLQLVIALGQLSARARADVPPPASDAKPPKSGIEVGLFPLIGGNTDTGFGAGAIGGVASFDPTNPIYLWKLDFSGFYATKGFPPTPSYIDAATKLTLPQLLCDHLRLEIRPAFTLDAALPFYGFGNKPFVPSETVADRDFYQRLHTGVSVSARWRLSPRWFVVSGLKGTLNKVTTEPGSTLSNVLATVDPYLTKYHGVIRLEAGIAYDSRDNEIAPASGQWHQLTARESPRLGDAIPYDYRQYNATARFYFTLIPRTLLLAFRGVVDLQAGNVPFYEESRFEDTSAIGGGQGVRGVPAYSFYGRAKVFGNAEVRLRAWVFNAMKRRFNIGFAGFFDAGRLWTDIKTARPELDGRGLSLHYGIGGGIRLQQGRAFLIRADVAWSPDAKPIGAYLMAEQAF